MNNDSKICKKIAFYHGCFANYYYPEVGKALIEVMKMNDIEVIIPDQVCCALPLIAKGNIDQAHKNMEFNVRNLIKAANRGFLPISTCPSCSLMIKRDYYRLLNSPEALKLSRLFCYYSEYLIKLYTQGELNPDLKFKSQRIFYHTSCHLRAQQICEPSVDLLKLIPGTSISFKSEVCCGMGGAYGFEKTNYILSKNIASRLYGEINENTSDFIVSDCGGCKLQIEAGTSLRVHHPIVVFSGSYKNEPVSI